MGKPLMWILWPSFIVGGIAEGVFFTLIDPRNCICSESLCTGRGRRFIRSAFSCSGSLRRHQALLPAFCSARLPKSTSLIEALWRYGPPHN